MNNNTAEVIKYIAGGIGTLLFIGTLTWCHIEEKRIQHTPDKTPACDCQKQKKQQSKPEFD